MNFQQTGRVNALTVGCPYCGAEAGALCVAARGAPRTACHAERHQAYAKTTREERFYDLDQDYIPPGYVDEPPAVEDDLTDIPAATRINGLGHCHELYEQLAARGLPIRSEGNTPMPRQRTTNVTTCRSCDTSIVFAAPIGTDGGRRHPIDAEPSPTGTIRLFADGTYMVLNAVDAKAYRSTGTPLHVSHFATCPHANRHRKKRPA